jgi:hypothetical protein
MSSFLERLKGLFSRKSSQEQPIEIDDEGVTRHLSDGKVERVQWDDLVEVEIITTDEGPWLDDMFYVLHGGGSGCVVPSEHSKSGELLERLQRLPGFDNAKVIEASSCTENARFVCWRKAESDARRSDS